MRHQTVSFFRNLRVTKPSDNIALEQILSDIQSGKWKKQIEKCRLDLKHKDWLPVFTPTGIFSHRSIGGLDSYNGIVCMDIDHVEDVATLKKQIITIPWIYAAFITPSGKGLKVIVFTNATKETYREVEESVANAFFNITGYMRDVRAKDIARVQFISWDEDLYINTNSDLFEHEFVILEQPIELSLF